MSPLTSRTITRLDPRYPMLWRDEQTIQFGLDDLLRVPLDDGWVERVLHQLRLGIRMSTFDLVAHGAGAPRDAARALLDRLRPLLVTDAPITVGAWVEGVNTTDHRSLPRLRDALADEGIPAGHRDDPDALGIIVVEGAAAALHLARYLRDDTAHLPIAFEAAATVIGPLVVPGQTPCLSCRDAAETARDADWPLLHSQLVGRSPGSIPLARIAEAAALVPRLLRAVRPGAGLSVRIRPDGRRSWRWVAPHAECRCLASSSRSPREIERAPARLVPPSATTSSREYARPA